MNKLRSTVPQSLRFLRIVFKILILSVSLNTLSATKSLYIVHSGIDDSNKPLFNKLIDRLQTTKPASHTIKQLNIRNLTIAQLEQTIVGQHNCIVTIGEFALEKALATRPATPIFSILVAKDKLDNLIANYRRFGVSLSGIYHEQSFQRQLLLAKSINQQVTNVGVLLGTQTRYSLPRLQQIANQNKINLNYYLLKHHAAVKPYFERLPIDKGFLMILNDTEHYSKSDLQSLMLVSNQRNIPMIGSKIDDSIFAALASVYTPKDYLAAETAISAGKMCSGSSIPDADYGQKYAVSINPHVAEFLGYNNLNEANIMTDIRRQEAQLK